jgi:hypothetical protein
MSATGRCYCTAKLRIDGTCPYACDPALRRPSMRRRSTDKALREREQASTRIGLSIEDARAALAKVSGLYAGQYADNHDRAKRAWSTRRCG